MNEGLRSAAQGNPIDPVELRPLPDEVVDLLVAVGAPARLGAHLRLVHDVAVQLTGWMRATWRDVGFDAELVAFGAATHDIGKALHPNEITGDGHDHEAAGQASLLRLGVAPSRARFAITHSSWHDSSAALEDLLAVADKVWKAAASKTWDVVSSITWRLSPGSMRGLCLRILTTSSNDSPTMPTHGSFFNRSGAPQHRRARPRERCGFTVMKLLVADDPVVSGHRPVDAYKLKNLALSITPTTNPVPHCLCECRHFRVVDRACVNARVGTIRSWTRRCE